MIELEFCAQRAVIDRCGSRNYNSDPDPSILKQFIKGWFVDVCDTVQFSLTLRLLFIVFCSILLSTCG